MIRIAFVVTGLEMGGAETMLLKLLASMDRTRFAPSLVTLRGGGPLTSEFEALGIPKYDLGIGGPLTYPSALLRLRKLGHALEPHLIQGWMYHGNLGASIMHQAIGRQSPLLWSVRVTADGRNLGKPLTRWIIRWGANNSRTPKEIVYNSVRSADQHAQIGYCSTNTLIIPNGFDTERFKPSAALREQTRAKLGLTPETPVVGIVGRYNPIKDHKTFIESAALVKAERPDTRFLMIGRGIDANNEEIGRLLDLNGLGDSVQLLGMQNHTEELFPAMDVHVLSSVSEGFPNVLGEAMSCGVPCVVTDAGDSAAIVSTTGSVVSPQDPKALAKETIRMLDEAPAERQARGEAARRRIIEHFSLESVTRRFEDLYAECVFAGQTTASNESGRTSMKDRRGSQ